MEETSTNDGGFGEEDDQPGESGRTCPLAINYERRPPRPRGVTQADFECALTKELQVQTVRGLNVHGGQTPESSSGCIVIGTQFTYIRMKARVLTPGTVKDREYMVPGFDLNNTVESHVRLNAALCCAKRISGESPTIQYRRAGGNPARPRGLLPLMPVPLGNNNSGGPPAAIPINEEGGVVPVSQNRVPGSGGTGGFWGFIRRLFR